MAAVTKNGDNSMRPPHSPDPVTLTAQFLRGKLPPRADVIQILQSARSLLRLEPNICTALEVTVNVVWIIIPMILMKNIIQRSIQNN